MAFIISLRELAKPGFPSVAFLASLTASLYFCPAAARFVNVVDARSASMPTRGCLLDQVARLMKDRERIAECALGQFDGAAVDGPSRDRELFPLPLIGTQVLLADQPQAAEHFLLARRHFREAAVGNRQLTLAQGAPSSVTSPRPYFCLILAIAAGTRPRWSGSNNFTQRSKEPEVQNLRESGHRVWIAVDVSLLERSGRTDRFLVESGIANAFIRKLENLEGKIVALISVGLPRPEGWTGVPVAVVSSAPANATRQVRLRQRAAA